MRSAVSYDLVRLRAGIKPFRLHWFARLRSTNDYAAALRRRGELFAPACVLTGHQFAGRGRGSNTWWSGRGSITVTFAIPVDEHVPPHTLPLVAGLAMRQAAAELCGAADVQLKWPNDVLHDGRKLAGLLCERVEKADLVGVGLNVNVATRQVPGPLRSHVTSLAQIRGTPIDLTNALLNVARHLHEGLSRRGHRPLPEMLRLYDQHHALIGRGVRVDGAAGEPPVTGVCEGLDGTGRLLVRQGRRLHHVIAGHVSLIE